MLLSIVQSITTTDNTEMTYLKKMPYHLQWNTEELVQFKKDKYKQYCTELYWKKIASAGLINELLRIKIQAKLD